MATTHDMKPGKYLNGWVKNVIQRVGCKSSKTQAFVEE